MANILVIDDQPALCQLYRSVLGQFNHNVVLAYTGQAGVDAALRLRPDLVVLDLLLPGMSGTEVARKLREGGILPATPLIITTGLWHQDAQRIARSLGATAVVNKPFAIGSMLTTVQAALLGPSQEAPLRQPGPTTT